MTDILKYNDAVDNNDITLKFGSTRIGRYILDPYTGVVIDLKNDRDATLRSPQHLSNPNVINFIKYVDEYIKTIPEDKRWMFEYHLEVPFPNPDVKLFNQLYAKFGDGSLVKRHWFRVDVYFPFLGIVIELDSDGYHSDLEVALDNAKENLIYEHYGIKTALRINLASTKDWENKRRVRELYKTLGKYSANPITRPIILYDTIVNSWNIKNAEILPFFPYVESTESNYYTKHDQLYKERDVYLNYNALPINLQITLDRMSIQVALKNVYKRVKNVNLAIIKP